MKKLKIFYFEDWHLIHDVLITVPKGKDGKTDHIPIQYYNNDTIPFEFLDPDDIIFNYETIIKYYGIGFPEVEIRERLINFIAGLYSNLPKSKAGSDRLNLNVGLAKNYLLQLYQELNKLPIAKLNKTDYSLKEVDISENTGNEGDYLYNIYLKTELKTSAKPKYLLPKWQSTEHTVEAFYTFLTSNKFLSKETELKNLEYFFSGQELDSSRFTIIHWIDEFGTSIHKKGVASLSVILEFLSEKKIININSNTKEPNHLSQLIKGPDGEMAGRIRIQTDTNRRDDIIALLNGFLN